MFLTQSRLGTLDFNEDEILKIIRALKTHRTDDHDDMSIRICDRTLLKPLNIRITQIFGKGLTLYLYIKK